MTFLSSDLVISKASDGSLSTTMSEDLVSSSVDVRELSGINIQLEYTGAPVGTFTLQASNDRINPVPQTWNTIPFSATPITSAGEYMLNVDSSYYGWIRVLYTRTSGTGTLNIKIVGKG